MNIDSMLTTFVETYPRDAITYIDNMKRDIRRADRRVTIKLVNTCESCNNFAAWAKGFASYCIEEAVNGRKASIDDMTKTFDYAINNGKVVCEKDYLYPEIPSFITGYIEGIPKVQQAVTEAKSMMMEHDIDQEIIGGIEDFVDKFTDALQESFTPGMNTLLRASGYVCNQLWANRSRHQSKKEEKHVFI